MKLVSYEQRLDQWTNNELRSLIHTLVQSSRNGAELEYFDEEIVEHLSDDYLKLNSQAK